MTRTTDSLLDRIGRLIARWLDTPTSGYEPYTPSDPETLARTLREGDILLVEGNRRISQSIKYLTQSTFSHAAIYVGGALRTSPEGPGRETGAETGAQSGGTAPETPVDQPRDDWPSLIEVNLGEGCVAVPLSKYATYNTRICRPVGLTPEDRDRVVAFMVSKIGLKYDMKNIFDLLRYSLGTPPVPVAWRRRMLAFGSGDPTRAICSSLIAQAFQAVGYPILPDIVRLPGHAAAQSDYSRREIMHIRHHSLFTPRDFDLSPYFRIVKPTIEFGFDYKSIEWRERKVD
ncbi:lipo-like protein [Pseudohoeflea coraliihabitans]|uniref:Lipo-like protein n=1 Tax=Pseudohoeflea coraliihabitans TaxID=2860393 RepID=A0ABS6WP20_9HYPH|nr:lipo-like protein [Pseudohoeflea sp. DP4N28-3]MBW3097693.1 lipo-like protein [Pseudohoeflea sp. DP4N28-3]